MIGRLCFAPASGYRQQLCALTSAPALCCLSRQPALSLQTEARYTKPWLWRANASPVGKGPLLCLNREGYVHRRYTLYTHAPALSPCTCTLQHIHARTTGEHQDKYRHLMVKHHTAENSFCLDGWRSRHRSLPTTLVLVTRAVDNDALASCFEPFEPFEPASWFEPSRRPRWSNLPRCPRRRTSGPPLVFRRRPRYRRP